MEENNNIKIENDNTNIKEKDVVATADLPREKSKEKNKLLKSYNLSENSITNLSVAGQWAKFISIIGFIFCGFFLIIGLIIIIASTSMNSFQLKVLNMNLIENFNGLSLIILSLLLLPAFINLNDFSNKMFKAIYKNQEKKLDISIKRLSQFFKYVGLAIVVLIVLYTIAILLFVLFGVTAV